MTEVRRRLRSAGLCLYAHIFLSFSCAAASTKIGSLASLIFHPGSTPHSHSFSLTPIGGPLVRIVPDRFLFFPSYAKVDAVLRDLRFPEG